MKIVYCIGGLIKPGGAERVLINKANYFADVYGYEVHILIANQNKQPYCYAISNKVKVHDMHIVKYLTKWNLPLISFFANAQLLKPVYLQKIKEINPNIIFVIERGYDDFIIPELSLAIPVVRESHSSMEAVKIMDSYNAASLKQQLINKVFTFFYERQLKKYTHVVLLTEKDALYRPQLKSYSVIPNVVTEFETEKATLENKKAISVGRLDIFKNYKDQLLVWSKIIQKHPEWTLHIYGEGKERTNLIKQLQQLGLQHHVFLEGASLNVQDKYKESSFFIFTSLAEGFGMVLVEAMQVGLPVISYNCPCGPSEIITHGKDGFLVNVGDLETLQTSIELLIENAAMRKELGTNAVLKSNKYMPEVVMKQWDDLIRNLTNASN